MSAERKFNRKERDHLDVLQRRLDYLREQHDNREIEGPAMSFIRTEINALRWALGALGALDATDLRLERVENELRAVKSRLGRIEKWVAEEDDDGA